MQVYGVLSLVFAISIAASLASTALAAWRLTRPRKGSGSPRATVGVSIVRPLCGLETYSRETLESGFRLAHPAYELIFCVHSEADPVMPLVRRLAAENPQVPAQLLIGDPGRTANPKLDNCLKGWAAAQHDWVVLADSNVDMPPDYLQRLLRAWRPNTGLVCSMPLGTRPVGVWAEVECAFLNGFQVRWQYAAEAVGFGYAQGKSMLWNKRFLDRRGGLMALADEAAEDAAATKLVRSAGLRVHLVDAPFGQPIGRRRLGDTWRRQLRWSRLRRATFPLLYPLECLTSPLAAAGGLAATLPWLGLSPWLAVLALAACYGAELALVRRLGWPQRRAAVVAMLVRDLLIPAIWMAGLFGRSVSWHGRSVPVSRRAARPVAAGALP